MVKEPVEKVEDVIEQQVEQTVEHTVNDKPKKQPKMITCPDCNKSMLEKTFRYKHINACNKPKVPRAKPIEVFVEEKKAIKEQPVAKPKPKPKPKPKVEPKVEEPPTIDQTPKNEFWERRRLHTNLLNERKQALVKKIMVKAF